jgi:uncharacterized repeat protein (TIGR01451 family)
MLTIYLKRFFLFTLILIIYISAEGQSIRPYAQVFSENIKGGTAIFGNTILHIRDADTVSTAKMNETGNANNGQGGIGFSQYGNDFENMQYAMIDAASSNAPTNATSADLILPTGTNTIKFARLYWGGRLLNSTLASNTDTLRKIKIRKGSTGSYTNLLAAPTSVDQYPLNVSEITYQAYADIKPFIQSNGGGTYTIADVPCTTGATANGGNYAGWTIIIAYENTTLPYNSVRIYDGFSLVFNNGASVSQLITLNGLNVPNNPLQLGDATMSTMVWEGDANLGASASNTAGDYIKINDINVSNGVNPINNFWNGSISKNGVFVETKNPNYTNQMGIDIDEVQVGTDYNILPNATSVNIEFGTEADRFYPSVFGFAIKMKEPIVTLDNIVKDANNNGFLESNEVLTYTLSGSNLGTGNGLNTFVVDSIPRNVTYVPNSLKIISGPGITTPISVSDAEGDDFGFKSNVGDREYVKIFIGNNATANSGGEMAIGESYVLTVQVKVPLIPGSVVNTARVTTTSQAGDIFTDDGTAFIGPSNGPTPITLTIFEGKQVNKNAALHWVTENEINNDHFEVEKSEDGIHFYQIANVKGNGSSSTVHEYNLLDHLNANVAIVYYRLKNVDFDGKFYYSKIIAIKITGITNEKFTVFPNPFIDHIKVMLSVKASSNSILRIIAMDGKVVYTKNIMVQKGENIYVVDALEKLSKASYIVEINTGTEKLIKQIIKK